MSAMVGRPAAWVDGHDGIDAVLAVCNEGSPEGAKADIDVTKTYAHSFVERAKKTTGMDAR